MKRLLYLFLLLPFLSRAQESKGVHFEDGMTWAAIQAKAKAENKYIFMDCYTTWCGPCKYMSAKVFPQEVAGNYFNDKFISVGVQLDSTAKDNEGVKSWYADAHGLAEKYEIRAYPTFLVFSPDGHAVHRMVGSTQTAEEFITRTSAAFDPGKQYYTLLGQYQQGKKDSGFLRKMALASLSVYDMKNARSIGEEYLATQSDLYGKGNLEFIDQCTESSKDKGFAVFLNNPQRVDKVLGDGKAEEKVRTIILREEVLSKLRRNGPAPDWALMQKEISQKYPAQADEVVAQGKVVYFQGTNNWPEFQPAIVGYMKKYGARASGEQLNNYAWTVFQHCPDMSCVTEALDWSKRSFKDKENPMFMDTYANILYKMGKKDEALVWEEKAINIAGEGERASYQQTLDKMKKGEKTWD